MFSWCSRGRSAWSFATSVPIRAFIGYRPTGALRSLNIKLVMLPTQSRDPAKKSLVLPRLKTSGKRRARFCVAPPVVSARLLTALRSFCRSVLAARLFPLPPARPWRIDDFAQQRLSHQTAPVCPPGGAQLQKSKGTKKNRVSKSTQIEIQTGRPRIPPPGL